VGLCPSSGILKTREYDVSETGSVSVLGGGGGDTKSVGSVIKIKTQTLENQSQYKKSYIKK
jgi:hypothetical protein